VQIEQMQRKMALPGYSEKTPEEVRATNLERLVKMEAELESIRHHIQDMRSLLDASS
jgi:hypothetical protein